MLQILGIGASRPATVFRGINVSLPPEILEEDSAVDIIERRKKTLVTPTELGVQAANAAIAMAGISAQQLGLVIGDCGTPFETCPSEGQRIAGQLGLKVPSYDIIGGLAAFPVLLQTLANFHDAKIPDYVLFVSTNLPSQHVDYRNHGPESELVGDGAGALILSSRNAGRLQLKALNIERTGRQHSPFNLGESLSFDSRVLWPDSELKAFMRDAIKRSGVPSERLWCLGPEIYGLRAKTIATEIGIAPLRFVSSTLSGGFALGGAPLISLSEVLGSISQGEFALILVAGDGAWRGSILLEVN